MEWRKPEMEFLMIAVVIWFVAAAFLISLGIAALGDVFGWWELPDDAVIFVAVAYGVGLVVLWTAYFYMVTT